MLSFEQKIINSSPNDYPCRGDWFLKEAIESDNTLSVVCDAAECDLSNVPIMYLPADASFKLNDPDSGIIIHETIPKGFYNSISQFLNCLTEKCHGHYQFRYNTTTDRIEAKTFSPSMDLYFDSLLRRFIGGFDYRAAADNMHLLANVGILWQSQDFPTSDRFFNRTQIVIEANFGYRNDDGSFDIGDNVILASCGIIGNHTGPVYVLPNTRVTLKHKKVNFYSIWIHIEYACGKVIPLNMAPWTSSAFYLSFNK